MKALTQITFALICAGSIASAQIVPFEETGEYRIAKVVSGNLCYAALKSQSVAGKPMVYTYYETKIGQRWHVLGYGKDAELEMPMVNITIDIDGETTLARETQTSDSDFMFPFENLEELQAYEALRDTGTLQTVTIAENGDKFELQLEPYRAALATLQDCLAEIKE